jgi:cobalt-zinc-cadmium efflux system protein
VLGLGLAWAAATIARRTPTERHTYGWRRATLLSPLANALLLVAFAGALSWESMRRLGAPPQIPALPVIVVAAFGILVNLGGAWLLRGGHSHDLNRRGAYLHLLADPWRRCWRASACCSLAGAGSIRPPGCWSAWWWR